MPWLDSAAAPGFQVGAADALLLVYDQNTEGKSRYGQYMASSPRNSVPLGEKINLRDQPFSRLWPAGGKNILFVGNVKEEKRLRVKDKQNFAAMNVKALAIMFLSVGNLQIGQIIIRWQKEQTFTQADERLYGAIAQQASSVVYNRLLFNQTEEALSETAALYQASADINTAQSYDEVLTALRQHTILGQGSHIVSISFFDRPWEKDQTPEEVYFLATWNTANAPSSQPQRFRIDDIPGFRGLVSPEEIIVHGDVANDERIGNEFRTILMEEMDTKGVIYAPLYIGSRRVGFINGYYDKTLSFSEQQIRRLNVLVRQAAVTIQSLNLLEQTRRRANRESLINSINQKIQSAPTVQFALQTAVNELGQALNLKKAVVELAVADQENENKVEIQGRSAEPA